MCHVYDCQKDAMKEALKYVEDPTAMIFVWESNGSFYVGDTLPHDTDISMIFKWIKGIPTVWF